MQKAYHRNLPPWVILALYNFLFPNDGTILPAHQNHRGIIHFELGFGSKKLAKGLFLKFLFLFLLPISWRPLGSYSRLQEVPLPTGLNAKVT